MENQEYESLFKFESPSSTVIAGPSMSGKTVLTLAILRRAESMYTIPPERILYAYGVHQKKFDELEAEVANMTTHHGLPTRELIDELKSADDSGHSLLVLDDLMDEICKSSEMCSLFTRDEHHSRISVIMLSQNIYHQSRYSRTISLNTSYLILLKTCRDLQQIHFLSRQMFPGTPKRLVEAYEDATYQPRGYLVVNNLTSSGDEDVRLSTSILPGDTLVLYTRK
jgi:Cdc6-like AAA superfamily ATPase